MSDSPAAVPFSARRAYASGRKGLSIVELLVAVTILAVGLAAYIKLSLASRVTVDKGQYYSIASVTAANALSNYQSLGYSGLPVNGTTVSGMNVVPNGQQTVVIGPLDGNAANTNIKQIDITISWGYGLSSQAGSVTQSLLVSAYP